MKPTVLILLHCGNKGNLLLSLQTISVVWYPSRLFLTVHCMIDYNHQYNYGLSGNLVTRHFTYYSTEKLYRVNCK